MNENDKEIGLETSSNGKAAYLNYEQILKIFVPKSSYLYIYLYRDVCTNNLMNYFLRRIIWSLSLGQPKIKNIKMSFIT